MGNALQCRFDVDHIHLLISANHRFAASMAMLLLRSHSASLPDSETTGASLYRSACLHWRDCGVISPRPSIQLHSARRSGDKVTLKH